MLLPGRPTGLGVFLKAQSRTEVTSELQSWRPLMLGDIGPATSESPSGHSTTRLATIYRGNNPTRLAHGAPNTWYGWLRIYSYTPFGRITLGNPTCKGGRRRIRMSYQDQEGFEKSPYKTDEAILPLTDVAPKHSLSCHQTCFHSNKRAGTMATATAVPIAIIGSGIFVKEQHLVRIHS